MCVQKPSGLRKLFQVIFRKDGSIFVNFPYFKRVPGIVVPAIVPAGGGEVQVDLTLNGRVTSHGVKFSHHRDGNAHFSQDGKVYSSIRRRSVCLDDSSGHLFTVHITEPDAFARAAAKDERQLLPNPKRTTLRVNCEERVNRLKFVAWWYSVRELVRRNPGVSIRPNFHILQGNGTIQAAFACAPLAPPEGADERVLVMSVEEWDVAGSREGGGLLFMGGFDPPDVTTDPGRSTQMLMCSYPVEDEEALRRRIGSIDYP